ncbi:MAG: aspartate aminotransferase family protein [Spongiibacteraceae bacterium]|nr:aspartate aminotransferase family protein [Spongiibacteraceae bacterium]
MDNDKQLNRQEREAYWMPFTPNQQFKDQPRMIVGAKGMYYTLEDGRTLLDGISGLWCCNAGHGRHEITQAISKTAANLDYSPAFQMAHPMAFELANRLKALAPEHLDYVFFSNSGSEAVDTALKMARAYWHKKGEKNRLKIISREKGYHGVNIGGTSVSGIEANRQNFGPGIDVEYLSHTLLRENAFTRGLPNIGAEKAHELETMIQQYGPSTIAAVIVEPFAGSAGVILPPQGYLHNLRKICDHYNILLIFDEVISGFGRLGSAFASQEWAVTPDIITCAKGLTNGTIPMGAVIAHKHIYEAFMQGPEHSIEFPHGYTYSAHPVACAAALATLDIYQQDKLFQRSKIMSPYFENAVHQLQRCNNVIDIRNYGLVAAVELKPRSGAAGKRARDTFLKCYQTGALVRFTGDTLALAPPLIIKESEIDKLINILGEAIDSSA